MADDPFRNHILNDPQAFIEFITLMQDNVEQAQQMIDAMTLVLASRRHNIPLPIPMHNSEFNRDMWVKALLTSNPQRMFNALRMGHNAFYRLCELMECKYGLTPTRNVSIQVDVAILLRILGHGVSIRTASEKFSLSNETISHHFKRSLSLMRGFTRDYIKPNREQWTGIHPKLAGDARYDPYFKDAIGALDGTHIKVIIPGPMQLEYRGRSGDPTQNVLGVCDFNMLFTYVVAGGEGSMHDARVLQNARANPHMNFPEPPPGKYYLGDKGYANRDGVMAPYFTDTYHPAQFRGAPPSNRKEYFNRAHSSLRSVIERCYGALKKKWQILDMVPPYDVDVQSQIICACFALHNYVMLNKDNSSDSSQHPSLDIGRGGAAANDDEEEVRLPDDDPVELADPLSMTNLRNQIADAIDATVRA